MGGVPPDDGDDAGCFLEPPAVSQKKRASRLLERGHVAGCKPFGLSAAGVGKDVIGGLGKMMI